MDFVEGKERKATRLYKRDTPHFKAFADSYAIGQFQANLAGSRLKIAQRVGRSQQANGCIYH